MTATQKRTRKRAPLTPVTMLSPRAAAQALRKSPEYVHGLIADGTLKAVFDEGRWIIFYSSLEEFRDQLLATKGNHLAPT